MPERKLTSDEIKKIELNILLAFHVFCKEHELQYSLCGGSLLGAVRHKGFIPWDDDIDVFMPRPDYEKLRELTGGKCIAEKFYLLDWRNPASDSDKRFMYYPFLKLIDLTTRVDAVDFDARKYYSGIWIDIFPIDGLPESDSATKKIYKKSWFWRQMFSLHFCDKIVAKGLVQKIIKAPFLPVAKIMNGIKLCKRLDDLSMQYNYADCEYVGGIINGYGPQEKLQKKELELTDVEFEGRIVNGIKGYDVYLTNLYHDYMQLPPKEKRICHGFDAWYVE